MKFYVNVKRIIILILTICLVYLSSFANYEKKVIANEAENENKTLEVKNLQEEQADDGNEKEVVDEYKSIAKSENLELLVNEKIGAVAVKDLRNGYIWRSVVNEDLYDTNSLNLQWKMYLKSVIALNYINIAAREVPPVTVYSSNENVDKEISKINGGVEINYIFKDIGISVAVQFLIEDDCFIVKIPADKIKEEPVTMTTRQGSREITSQVQYGIVSIEVLPFFGAATDDVDGYLLYPDGPGGLTLYSEADNRPADVKIGKWYVYSLDNVNIKDLFGEENERYRAHMPIFGVKNNDNAFLAVITEGAEGAAIVVYPSGYVVNINHIGTEFIYRHYYELNLSDVSIDNVRVGKKVSRAERDLNRIDREIRYFMLNDERANYSEMANVYRNYLLEKGLLNTTSSNNPNNMLLLTILMGITEERMIIDKFIPMTTIEQLMGMIEELKESGIDYMSVILRGWQKGGYGRYPNNWPFDRRLGGKKYVQKLNEFVKANDIDMYLENSFIYALDEVGGFSRRNDVVLDGVKLPVIDENLKARLFNPTVAAQRNTKFLESLKPYEGFGVAYEHLGKVIYRDYHRVNPSNRYETVLKWQEIIGTARDYGRKVAVEGANQYGFAKADFIYDIPIEGYGYFTTDKQIPFLQMVLHGYIPYSSKPGNLSYDLQLEKLKWIEYGCIPHFELTKEKTLKLKNTEYDHLFTSTFDLWKEKVVEIYKEFKENLVDIYSSQMVFHNEVAPNVIEVKYSNGYTILINYNEIAFHIYGKRIPAKDYVIIKGGTN